MGERIKIKDIEGDSEDIRDLFLSNNCNLAEYLEIPNHISFNLRWLIGCVCLYIVVLCILWNIPSDYIICYKILMLLSIALAVLSVVLVHAKYKNYALSFIAIIGVLILYLIAANIYTPEEVAKKIERHVDGRLTEQQHSSQN